MIGRGCTRITADKAIVIGHGWARMHADKTSGMISAGWNGESDTAGSRLIRVDPRLSAATEISSVRIDPRPSAQAAELLIRVDPRASAAEKAFR